MLNINNDGLNDLRVTANAVKKIDSRYSDLVRYKSAISPVLDLKKLAVALAIMTSSSYAQAAIINDNSERRIQVRYGADNAQVYVNPSYQSGSRDSMQGLIEQKNSQYNFDAQLTIDENKRLVTIRPTTTRYNTQYSTPNNNYNSYRNYNANGTPDFNSWLNSNQFRAQEVASFQRYLVSQVGSQNVPPLAQLLTTARSWEKCGYEPYQLPPRELWANIVPTLRLYSALKNQGALPASAEIRSVYRSPNLNDCAGGADNSKHMTAGAIDIWVPNYENDFWQLSRMQDSLCQFWQYQGQAFNFGLGLYSTGAIHLDTQGYRKWGFNNASSSSSCRY